VSKPCLLIAGGSHSEIPLIKAAKKLGFYVITSGNRPEDLGHQFSDEMRLADFSVKEAMLKLATDLSIDAIIPGCNDFSAISSAYVAEELRLPGHDPLELVEMIHHKDRYRAMAKALGIASPRAFGCADFDSAVDAIQKLEFPIIIKPVDLTGGKGISRADTLEAAILAVSDAFVISRAKRVVIEEFIDGTRHGFSAFLQNGQISFYFADDEYYHLSPYLVSAASAPSSCAESALLKIKKDSEKLARALGLVDGIFHVQFIKPSGDDPVIIEICRRAPGDLYTELVRHSAGVPYAEWIVRASSGLPVTQVSHLDVAEIITRHCLMADRSGTFDGFEFDPEVSSSIIDRLVWAKTGDQIKDPLTHKFGIVFVHHDNLDQRERVAPRLQQLLGARVQERL
jgi:biotin carboxylase